MSNKEKLPKLVDVYRPTNPLGRRQLPLVVDENLTLVMDVKSSGIICDNQMLRGKELEEFACKWSVLSPSELHNALQITKSELMHVLNQNVPCVGCRRSVDRLYYQLHKFGHPTLDPLVVKKDGTISINEDKQAYQIVGSIFHGHAVRLDKLIENQPKRNKKSVRCLLHSLDSQRSRPLTPVWRDVWDCMRPDCKKDVCIIEATSLHTTLETYLRKHRFCGECRTKVLKAYTLLVEEPEPTKEKGYIASLYAGIKRCLPNKHIHLQAKTDYITKLISRAEPELLGSRRERHAKTLEIAQEEVLTCLGICMYERLHRIYMRMREEECTCQVFAAVAVHTLSRSFETVVEKIRGVSQLELLYAEFAREEQQKQLRREQKKIKRKRKKGGKCVDQEGGLNSTETCKDCLSSMDAGDDDEDCSCSANNDEQQHLHPNSQQKCDECFTCEQLLLPKKNNKLLLHRHGGGGGGHRQHADQDDEEEYTNKATMSRRGGGGRRKKQQQQHNMDDEDYDDDEDNDEDEEDYDEDDDDDEDDDGLDGVGGVLDEDIMWLDDCKCNNNIGVSDNSNNNMAAKKRAKDNRKAIGGGVGGNNKGCGGGNNDGGLGNASCKCDTRSMPATTTPYFGDFTNHHNHNHHNHHLNNHHGGTKKEKDGGGSSSTSSSAGEHDCGYSSENNNAIGGGGIIMAAAAAATNGGGCCGGTSSTISSTSLSTSPEGSEVACSDTSCCQHDNVNDIVVDYNNSSSQHHHCRLSSYGGSSNGNGQQQLSLQEMLECHCEDDDDECYITAEEVREFKSNSRQVHEKRLELREMLQKRFAQFCVNGPVYTVPRLLLQTKYASN